MTTRDIYNGLNHQLKSVLLTSEGWLVGGAPLAISEGRVPKDYDIIVPSRELFQIVLKQITATGTKVEVNSFGGFKIQLEDGFSLDIWSEELSHFLMTANPVTYCYNMKRQILIQKL